MNDFLRLNVRRALGIALAAGLSGSALAALNATNFFPANGATNACADTTLQVTFDAAPKAGTSGLIRIYTGAGALVDTIDLSASSPVRLVGGTNYNYRPVLTNGNTLTLVFHANGLTNNQTYYVTIDATAFSNASSGSYAGITATNGWRFTTRAAGPPAGTNYVVVAADGSGDFCTVQGAVDFVPPGNTNRVVVFIRKGLYQEIVRINAKPKVTFRGESRKQTLVAYANNNNLNSGSGARVMFGVNADDIAIENLTLTNSTPKGGSQAEALNTTGLRDIVLNADCDSFQDTLKLDGTTYFQDCYIQGDTDFIWGYGPAYFTNCETKAMNAGYNCQCRNPATNYGEVFVNCRLTKAGSFTGHYLNRTDSKANANGDSNVCVMYINCAMDTHIPAVGWLNQFPSGVGTDGVRLWEYHSTDLNSGTNLNVSQRASFSRQLSSSEAAMYIQPTNIFGAIAGNLPVGNGWVPQLAPNLVSQPTNQIVGSNQTASFTVGATGIPAPVIQWYKNGLPVPAATNASLTVSNAQPGDSGVYTVLASNVAGVYWSGRAALVVNPIVPPQLGAGAPAGGPFTLAVDGVAGPAYTVQATSSLQPPQWQTLFTTNPLAMPFSWTDPAAGGGGGRYYRILAAAPAP
jgi:pectin methylesterase-like acyl-CoA thioesterase